MESLDDREASGGGEGVAAYAGGCSIACALAAVLPMAGAALLFSGAEQDCSMTALGGYVAAALCAGIACVVALVGLPLGIWACCRGRVWAGVVGITLNVLLLVAPVVAVLIAENSY
jgi:hypothetical protein